MAYQQINPIRQFNFQINRILTYGGAACDRREVLAAGAGIRTVEEWYAAWFPLGEKAQAQGRFLHAAYYFRLADFFLKTGDPRKEPAYRVCVENFYRAFDAPGGFPYRKYFVPFEGGFLPCLRIGAEQPKGTLLVCGGYDSFLEEFVPETREFAERGYAVLLFEGPGQGVCFSQGLFFRYDWEKPAAAVLNFFGVTRCAMIGISWGGYFALRCAAFEPRIAAAVAYDVMYDGFEVMTSVFPAPLRGLVRLCCRDGLPGPVNALLSLVRRKSILADWALSQGMAITGTKTPYDFYQKLRFHTMEGLSERLTQDILLLAGEKDHYIPKSQFFRQKEAITRASSLTCRMFTEQEGGEQHCQVGNHRLALDLIGDWLDSHFARSSV